MSIKTRVGRCYELAFDRISRVVLDHQDAYLIHGVIKDTRLVGAGAVICHAWVEQGGIVWEPVTDSELPTAVFLRMFDATEIHRYTAREAAQLAIKTEHSGPWHNMPDHEQRTLRQIEAEGRL